MTRPPATSGAAGRSGGARGAARGRPPRDARRVALDVLRAVREDDAYANLLLPTRISQSRLSPADAALATELTFGTLRNQGRLDAVLALVSSRPLDRIDGNVLDALRLGVQQLLETRIPPHAAVDATVQLVPVRARGFVNALLRAVSREPAERWIDRIREGRTGLELLAVRHSHPEWIVAALRDSLAAIGRDAELEDLLEADNAAPRVSLAALPGLATPDEAGDPGLVSPLGARSPGGPPTAIPAVAEGRVRVQDEGSQLAALALTRAAPVRPGERWLDLCAGPGGKTAILGAEAALGGATVLANELVPARADLVRRAVTALTPRPEVVVGDGARFATETLGGFDRVLLDAPCTGLGALRRRPEARWRKTPADLDDLVPLQARLLDAAIAATAPGGLIAYVTCSPHLAETREQVIAALDRHPGLEAVDTPAVLAGIATRNLDLPPARSAQLWPHRHGTDAMFIQLLRRP